MVGWLILVVFHVHLLYIVSGYTRDLRSMVITFERSSSEYDETTTMKKDNVASHNSTKTSIIFDPVCENLTWFSELVCEQFGCYPNDSAFLSQHVTSLISDKNMNGLKESYAAYLLRIDAKPTALWFQKNTDSETKEFHLRSHNETMTILNGDYSISSHCRDLQQQHENQSSHVLNFMHECALAFILSRYNIFDKNSISGNDWMYAAERLFNEQHYDQAEAMCYRLLFILLPKSILGKALPAYSQDLILRASTLLAEVSREKGYFKESVLFSNLAISSINVSTTPDYIAKTALYRLRILLTVPPIPPIAETARLERIKMEEDLFRFATDISRTSGVGAKLTLMVCQGRGLLFFSFLILFLHFLKLLSLALYLYLCD